MSGDGELFTREMLERAVNPSLPADALGVQGLGANWLVMRLSDSVTWTVTHYPRGCWKCRLRVRLRWRRPYRHFNCGPGDHFPGVPLLGDLLEP